MIEIIRITGETEELKSFSSATFFIIRNDWTLDVEIYCQSDFTGFCKRTDLDEMQVYNHISKMKQEGFTITTEKIYK